MTAAPRAFAALDLGFGDCGKGLVTDYLARRTGAGVVVRFNGGAQAGHNVVTPEGRHHTFAQLGAASFLPGVRTFLSRHVLVHPTALVLETGVLATKGVPAPLERVCISERARIVTPFHQAANRLRELARGAARHGSCGVGVGETVAHAHAYPDEAVAAADLRDPPRLRRKLASIRERLYAELGERSEGPAAERERAVFQDEGVVERWVAAVTPLARTVAPDALLAAWLRATPAVIFEGAQGLLLDETLGFLPHCTWSDCTARNARELLAEAAPGLELGVWGVLRTHALRHGPGPLPSESSEVRPRGDHNAPNPWQGPVRYGWFDAVLARLALALAGELEALVLTHVDLLRARPYWPVATRYRPETPAPDLVDAAGQLVAHASPPLERQLRLTELIARCAVELEDLPADEGAFLARLEARLGRPIDGVSRGPRATDLVLRSAPEPRSLPGL